MARFWHVPDKSLSEEDAALVGVEVSEAESWCHLCVPSGALVPCSWLTCHIIVKGVKR